MTVAQFAQHRSQNLKLLLVGHGVVEARCIHMVDAIPIDLLLAKETIMLVYHLPERLKIATRRVVIFGFGDARRKACKPNQ